MSEHPEGPTEVPILAELANAHDIVERIGRLRDDLAAHLGRIERTLAGGLPDRLRKSADAKTARSS